MQRLYNLAMTRGAGAQPLALPEPDSLQGCTAGAATTCNARLAAGGKHAADMETIAAI
jgi:hypothetical protein